MGNFKKIYVEITNKCNLDCSFCPKTKREPFFMGVEEFNMVIEKIKPYTNHIYMHIMGEPLSHPNILEFLDICQNHEIKVNITTNGTLLKNMGTKLLQKPALRQINISLHSLNDAPQLNFSTYINNIFRFLEEVKNTGKLIACLRLWNINDESATDYNKEIIFNLKEFFGVEKEILPKATDRHGIKLYKNIYLQQEEQFIWPNIKGEEIFLKGKCFGLKSHIGILSNGNVVPCCLDAEGEISLGNIYKQDLKDIINSQRATNMVEGFKRSIVEEKLCKTCGFRHNA